MVAITSNLAAVYDGAPVITDRNYAPSLYGPTVPVEVRRNVATNPRMLSAASLPFNNFPATNTLTKSAPLPVPHPQGIVTGAKSVSDGSSTELLSVYGVDNLTPAGSPERMLGVWVLVTEPGYRIDTLAGWPEQELTANTWTYLTQATPLSADTWAIIQVSRITGMASTTAECYITGCVAAPGTVPPAQFFDDQYSPDPDMTPELVPGGNGASRLTGLHPTGFVDVNCVSIIHEVGDGSRELRLIPTGASNNTGSWFSIPAGAPRSLATAIGTVRLPAALTGTLSPTARMIAAEAPYAGKSAAAPNQPGVYDLRGSVSGLTSSYRAHLSHGGSLGSGDVYWSKIGLFEGDYDGEWFTGTTISTDPHILYGWEGTPHASPATKSYRRFKHQGRTDPLVIAGWDETAESGTVVHHLMNGTVDATPRPAQLRSGVFALIYNDKVLAHEARRLFAAAGTYTLNHDSDPDLAMVFVAVGKIGLEYQADHNGEHTWVVTVGYQQVTA